MNKPALLLADEPTGALDSSSAEDVRQLLLDLDSEGQQGDPDDGDSGLTAETNTLAG